MNERALENFASFTDSGEKVYLEKWKRYQTEQGKSAQECENYVVREKLGKIWEEQASGCIKRAFVNDYESSVPAEYTKDHKAHCFLYIAVTQ